MPDIWFWQRIATPHMMSISVALGELGVKVTYVVEERMSADREKQGWLVPETGGVTLEVAVDGAEVKRLVDRAPFDSIHICQGIRANGLVGDAQMHLEGRGIEQWVVMETVRDVGLLGVVKRVEYSRLFRKNQTAIAGVLAIGYRTAQWLTQRGVPKEKVFPFAYFLEKGGTFGVVEKTPTPFKFIFVGQFIPLKRLDWLIDALETLRDQSFELLVIGSGPLEAALRDRAESLLKDKVKWIGRLPSNEVGAHIAAADCLVLPSLYDGWGAVVSEALMCGTQVICSDTCGSAGVVVESGVGGVFKTKSQDDLRANLEAIVIAGPVSPEQRSDTVAWSEVLGATAGAEYLLNIFAFKKMGRKRPQPPWSANLEK